MAIVINTGNFSVHRSFEVHHSFFFQLKNFIPINFEKGIFINLLVS